MRWWKVLGAAAFVGVAATGVAIARAERQRRAYTPDQVRDRLRDRVAQVPETAGQAPDQAVPQEAEQGRAGSVMSRLARRVRALAARLRRRSPGPADR